MMEFATFLFQGLAAFVGTIAFAVLFHVPRQQYLWAGVTGCLGWLCYLLMNRLTVSTVIASFVATLLLTAVSRFFAVWRRTPITIFLVCGIFPLVPGEGIYYTAYYFMMGDTAAAGDWGTQALKIAIAISLGIVVILSLPQKLFRVLLHRQEEA